MQRLGLWNIGKGNNQILPTDKYEFHFKLMDITPHPTTFSVFFREI